LLKNHDITVLIRGGQGPPKTVEPMMMMMIIIVLILWLWHHVILKYHRCSKQDTLWKKWEKLDYHSNTYRITKGAHTGYPQIT